MRPGPHPAHGDPRPGHRGAVRHGAPRRALPGAAAARRRRADERPAGRPTTTARRTRSWCWSPGVNCRRRTPTAGWPSGWSRRASSSSATTGSAQLFPGEYGLTPGRRHRRRRARPLRRAADDAGPRARCSRRSPRSTSPASSPACSTSTGSASSATPPAAPCCCSRRGRAGSRRCARSSRTARTRWPRRCSATRPTRCSRRRSSAPTMLIAGTDDGVVAASAIRYGEQAGAAGHDPVERTWREALPDDHRGLAGAPRRRRAHARRPPGGPVDRRAASSRPRPTPTTTASARCSADVVTTFLGRPPRAASPSAKAQLEQLAEQPQPEIAAVRRR